MYHDQVGFSPGMRGRAAYANYTSIDLRTEIYVITDDTHILTLTITHMKPWIKLNIPL